MTKFIKTLSLFLLPALMLVYPLDYGLSYLFRHNAILTKGENVVWDELLKGKINSDLVIYGSSRARMHFDATLMQNKLNISTYNLGILGHNFWFQELRHKLLLAHNTPPKHIIISVDNLTLCKQQLYHIEQVIPFVRTNEHFQNAAKSLGHGFSTAEYKLPLVRFTGRRKTIVKLIKSPFEKFTHNPRIRGFEGNTSAWNSSFFEELKSATKTIHVDVEKPLLKLFHQFLYECKDAGMQVIFVYTPQLVEGQFYFNNSKEIIALFHQIANQHNIPFLDYSQDDLCNHRKYYYDPYHLNKTGATIFTTKLIDDLKPILKITAKQNANNQTLPQRP